MQTKRTTTWTITTTGPGELRRTRTGVPHDDVVAIAAHLVYGKPLP
jgi:hypothetical protein